MQTGDINHVADNIYFSECNVDCPYCFNPEVNRTVGKLMTKEEIYNSLSNVQWVCLMGGEPLYLNVDTLHELVRYLRRKGKKVVLFTSRQRPWSWIAADHYHIDVKVWKGDVVHGHEFNTHHGEVTTVSYGLVACGYKDHVLRDAFQYAGDTPIYVKSNLVWPEHDGKREYETLNRMHASKVYINRKIEVD